MNTSPKHIVNLFLFNPHKILEKAGIIPISHIRKQTKTISYLIQVVQLIDLNPGLCDFNAHNTG